MKFLRAQGHFGVLDGREICFQDGLNVLYLPNEGGKTTLSHFLRVMLYGMNTSRRDTAKQLSDKTRFRPLDGNPMSGRLELEWKGRTIVISRQTGRGNAPMQEFSAYYADTGEPCSELTAKDCGKMLTGVTEEGFRSSAMLDGQEQAISAAELGDRMLALSTTGDTAMLYSNALAQLDHWRNEMKGSGSRGRYAEVEAELEQIDLSLARLDDLEEQIRVHQAKLPDAELHIKKAEAEHQQASESFTLLFVAKRETAERQERQARDTLAAIRETLPPVDVMSDVERAAKLYEQAKERSQQARKEQEEVSTHYQAWRDQIDSEEAEYSSREASDIHIRGWAMVLAILFGLLAVVSLLGKLPLGALGTYLPYIFSAFAIVFLVLTFVGSTRTLENPPMDFDDERHKLNLRRETAEDTDKQTGEELAEAREKFWEQLKRLEPEITEEDEEHALKLVEELRLKKQQYLEAKREHDRLTEAYLDILERTAPEGEARLKVNEAKLAADQAREVYNEIQASIASCRGKCEEIGTRESLYSRKDRLSEERENILWQLDAIRLAKEALVDANAELTGRVSPQINVLAQKYLRILTADRYTAMQLYTDFDATCRRENSAVEMDMMRLSTGTRDQLYLALRLAVCKILLDDTDGSVPLILDDPFVNYDDNRTRCGMKLLREIAQERQVILMTGRKPQ